MTTFLWLLVVAGGPALIGIVIAYAMLRSRPLTAGEKQAQHEAVDKLYHRDRDEGHPSPR
jgi:hypothetical protein